MDTAFKRLSKRFGMILGPVFPGQLGQEMADEFANIAIEEIAEWIRSQRNEVPMTGEEAANAILYKGE